MIGADRRTLDKALSGVAPCRKVNGRAEWSLAVAQNALKALPNDLILIRKERLRAERLENERREREAAIENRNLISMEAVRELISAIILPIRQRLLSLASEQCALCNPTDPAFAYKSLDPWANQTLRLADEASVDRLFPKAAS